MCITVPRVLCSMRAKMWALLCVLQSSFHVPFMFLFHHHRHQQHCCFNLHSHHFPPFSFCKVGVRHFLLFYSGYDRYYRVYFSMESCGNYVTTFSTLGINENFRHYFSQAKFRSRWISGKRRNISSSYGKIWWHDRYRVKDVNLQVVLTLRQGSP